MSRITKSVAAVVTALACAGLGYAPSAAAQTVPLTLTQQGRLLDNTGTPVDGVQLTFTFSLYTAASGGTGIWSETQVITPDKGYFSAKLGDVTAFPATIFDGSNATLFLGIKIGADAEMAPRQALTSVPFALLSLNALNSTHAVHADTAATATTATNATHATSADSATSATNAGTVTTIGGNFTQVTATGTGTQSVSCPSTNSIPTGGGCYSTGTSALINAGFVGGKSSFSYNCALANGGTVEAVVMCAK
jgi:hypothetical protein